MARTFAITLYVETELTPDELDVAIGNTMLEGDWPLAGDERMQVVDVDTTGEEVIDGVDGWEPV